MMFEIPRLYYDGIDIDDKTEVVIFRKVDIGNGEFRKRRFVVSRKYKSYLDAMEIKSLKKEIEELRGGEEIRKLRRELGENEAYIQELEEKCVSLSTQNTRLKEEIGKYRSGVKASEMYQERQKKIEARDKLITGYRETQNELLKRILDKDREIEKLKERLGEKGGET